MRKEYVKPAMQSEEFLTNSYCNSCNDVVLTGTLTVKPDQWMSSNGSENWSDPSSLFTGDRSAHTFMENVHVSNNQGKYWTCTDNDGYYLEHSNYWTMINKSDTFFLYQEANDKIGLQQSNANTINPTWPCINRGKDLCVAMVTYNEDKTTVANS